MGDRETSLFVVGAAAPGPVTAFGALDALLTRFADAQAFPALKAVVVAGHSAGGQLSQRYAAVARADAALKARGVAVRIVVANPSSYLWFGAERPYPPAPGACPDYDRWKYGIRGAPPEAGPAIFQDLIPPEEGAGMRGRITVYCVAESIDRKALGAAAAAGRWAPPP